MDKAKCPVCFSSDFRLFFERNGVPVHEGVLYSTQEAALEAPKGDIKLAHCYCCDYIGNVAFDFAKLDFTERYDIVMSHSPLYQDFLRRLALRLIDRYSLRNKTILEIACGKGDFLRLICQLGENHGIGIDPTFIPTENLDETDRDIVFIRDFYGEKYSHLQSDFVCCRHALDIISDPRDFMSKVRQTIDNGSNPILYFEVPDADRTFGDLVIWNLIYEKCSYFTFRSLAYLFNSCGFQVLNSSRCFEGGQYLGLEAASGMTQGGTIPDTILQIAPSVRNLERFADGYRSLVTAWKTKTDELIGSKKRVVAWGAGARAINFLTLLDIKDWMPYVVDINPMRQGKYLPGSGQLVVEPEFLRRFDPEVILITNPAFEGEIKSQVREMGLTCNFLSL